MDANEAKNKLLMNKCFKCKHSEKSSNCKECRECEYNFAINAITKLIEYEKFCISPNEMQTIIAERNYLLLERSRRELQLIGNE